MKAVKIFALFLVCFSNTHTLKSQGISSDSLANFSYLLVTGNDNHLNGAGTAFILKYHDGFFLVTNYHVLTGMNPYTGKMLGKLREKNRYVYLFVRPASRKNKLLILGYPLINEINHSANFATVPISADSLLDIAIMPVHWPFPSAVNYYLDINQVDTSFSSNDHDSLTVVGFPAGHFHQGWRPTISSVHTLISKKSNLQFIYYSDTTAHGTSGAPLFHKNKSGREMLVGISFRQLNQTDVKERGSGILISYVWDLIRRSYGHLKIIDGVLTKEIEQKQ